MGTKTDIPNDAAGIVEIDRNRLDKECVRLPTSYLFYAHKAAEAKLNVDEAKAALDVIRAELARDIRANPAVYHIEKVTDSQIEAAIALTPKYQKGLTALNKLKHELDLNNAVVNALEHKKRSLTLLVELFGLGYFGDVSISQAGKEALSKVAERRAKREE